LVHRDSPASMSIHEEATISTVGPTMAVFNNLVLFNQHEKQNRMEFIEPELAESWNWNEDHTRLSFRLRKRRGAETKLVLPGLAHQNHRARCDPALIKAIARGRAWFEELASGRARSLQELAKRDGISRRYIRRLISLAFLSPQLVEAILQGRQSVELTATRLTELDLPLDWTEQHKLLGG
jgi:hypothetical protein